jgi:hypothetical protein
VTAPTASAALLRVLAGIPEVAPPAEIDHAWVFAPRDLAGRESGLVVLSLLVPDGPPDQRRLLTVAYESTPGPGEPRVSRTVTEQGRAPADRIPRLIDGVRARLHDEPGDPLSEPVHGDPSRWSSLLERLEARPG